MEPIYVETDETRRLTEQYAVQHYTGAPGSSHGSWEAEKTAELFLSFSVQKKRFVGVRKDILQSALLINKCDISPIGGFDAEDSIDLMVENGHMVLEENDGAEYVLPTEDLLARQEIPRYDGANPSQPQTHMRL